MVSARWGAAALAAAWGWGCGDARAQGAAEEKVYRERYRPQFHFTARQWSYRQLNPGRREEGWQNDINGLVYVAGEYHYFAQRWAQAWIHAVSRDLVHWEELKPAFWTDDPVDAGWVQSGSVVVDSLNASGLKTGSNPLMLAFWSSGDNRNQCLSYSNDLGRTWTKYAGNPILAHRDRDPKVFFHAATGRWVMVLYDNTGYTFFTSANLLAWRKETSIAGFFECPDMFALAVDGKEGDTRWVLMNGDGSYRIGSFTGTSFSPGTALRRLDWGAHFYATQSWHGVPGSDGRRIQAVWMRADGMRFFPDMPFNQQTSFPAVLTLRDYADTLRLFRNPIREIENLHLAPKSLGRRSLTAGSSLALDASAELWHIKAVVSLAENSEGEFRIHGSTVKVANDALTLETSRGPFARRLSKVTVELLVDRTSIEAFGNDGEVSITQCIRAADQGMSFRCTKGSLTLDTLVQYPLKSIWPDTVQQGFSHNLGTEWTAVGGTWKDTATGRRGTGSGDIFHLGARTGGDFTYEGEVEIFTAAGAALVFRANDQATAGYCVNIDGAGFIKLWAPGRGEIMRFDTPINTRQPYHLKVEAKGPALKIFFNHRASPVLTYADPQPILAGRFGINLYNGSGRFQDLKVTDAGTPTVAPGGKASVRKGNQAPESRNHLGRRSQIPPNRPDPLNAVKRIKRKPGD